MSSRRLLLGTDIGGTFTDLVGFDGDSGQVFFGKSLTTYGDLVEGILDCVNMEGLDLQAVGLLKHGTTQVINTLLERRGARTALVTTKGFKDVIEIGRASRSLAFKLDYERSRPVVPPELRFEVRERIDADGNVLESPDDDDVKTLVDQLHRSDVDAVAVAFLNAYKNPVHEASLADRLRKELPGVYISAATEISREWFEYERFSTACANAYVGPRTATYVDRLTGRLNAKGFAGQVALMASNGGVLAPDRAKLQPLALVESGPIGGCIGTVAYAKALGLDRVIAFDMGGTTAKCALIEDYGFSVEPVYDVGGYDHGFPVRVPVLDIVEVGTGGGSIARVDPQGRLKVGPQSAGSEPGPACFGRGGTEPTITDANLVLGRISSGAFLRGSLTLDIAKASRAIDEQVGQHMGYESNDASIDAVANGILALAGADMASAIKEITVERGRDARDYALFVFGGGGPLHGVDLARELGIANVIVPPHPGNFSALGMLFADARSEETRTLLVPLDEEQLTQVHRARADIAQMLRQSLQAEQPLARALDDESSVELRFIGQRHALRIPLRPSDDITSIRQRFLAAYEGRYGYADHHAALEIVALRVVGVAQTDKPDLERLVDLSRGDDAPSPSSWRDVFHANQGARVRTAVYARSGLTAGAVIEGPAVIEEFGSTTVISPGDRLTIGTLGELRIQVASAAARTTETSGADRVDPIIAGLVANQLAAVPNVIDKNITRTAFSLLVSEYKDFAVGIVASDGRLVAQCKGGLPVFAANALSAAVQDGLRLFGPNGLQHGDVIITNTAATLGQHLNNVVMYTPIRLGPEPEALVGFMVVVMHWMDVGGYAVGSCTTTKTTDVFQEGIQFPSMKLLSGGQRVEEVYRLIGANTRFPEFVLGDASSQVAGCLMGRDMVLEIVQRFGVGTVQASIERFWQQSDAAVRRVVQELPDGRYEAEAFLDDDGVEMGKPLPIRVAVVVDGDELTIDLSGVAPEVTNGPWNAGFQGGAVAASRIAAKFFFGTDEPANDGAFRALRVHCPPGTLMSAGPTAPIAGSGHNLPSIVDTILKALAQAAPDRVPAGHHGTYGSQVMVAKRVDGRGWIQHMESSCGGWGAAHDRDGNGPFRSMAHGDTPEVPIEVQESLGLFRLKHMRLREDSGGAGRFRGCPGVDRAYEVLRDQHYSVMIERTQCTPWGVRGGLDGAPGRCEVIRDGEVIAELRKDEMQLRKGDELVFMSAGGGGFGHPLERPVEDVLADVRRGLVSQEAAATQYGVIFDEKGRPTATRERSSRQR